MWASAFKWDRRPKRPSDASICCGLFAAALLAASCDQESEARARQQAEAVARQVKALRDAPEEERPRHLRALEALPCAVDDICALRDTCARGFSLHARATGETRRLQQSVSKGQAPADAALRLKAAEEDLAEARTTSLRCADLEGALIRKYDLR